MRISIVANFYMDPEVCCRGSSASHPSDSWVLADMAVNMAKVGCQYITVLGADFMSQNLHAILDHAGFGKDETCIVHDLFGQERGTFCLAMESNFHQNLLDFIQLRAEEALGRDLNKPSVLVENRIRDSELNCMSYRLNY
ncbi:hypothetical protein MRB53_034861 [Persea americana]|uniref:Uncharacterized protein n=1 Tax=Persea americana TaxID=3435 RepID=A0ACC2K2Z8_PERAE|nr:hypothetical protein MRB53_034861 [Persea americana]